MDQPGDKANIQREEFQSKEVLEAVKRLNSELSWADALDAGEEPEHLADSLAAQLGELELSDDSILSTSDIASVLQSAFQSYLKTKQGSSDSYMPTDDTNLGKTFNDNPVPEDHETQVRFQSQAAKNSDEKVLADGIGPNGNKLELVEIQERQVVRGPYVKWEVRDAVTDEVVQQAGPLYLDDARYSDAALAEARMSAYQFLTDTTGGNMRIHAEKKCPECDKPNQFGELCNACSKAEQKTEASIEAEKQKRIAKIREQVLGFQLTAAQKQVLADVETNVMDYSEEFIDTVGSHFKHEFDPGSSWQLVEADGKSKLVRQELAPDAGPDIQTKHAFQAGQKLRRHSDILPDEVIVRECVGEHQYKVQSEYTGTTYVVAESELYDPTKDDALFEGEGTIGIPELFT